MSTLTNFPENERFEPEFWCASGGGNDFIALAEPHRDPTADEVRAWCRRGLSIGADGLFVLRRQAACADESEGEGEGEAVARVAMRHFNPDGGVAMLCLNGTRCAAQLAFRLGWARRKVEVLTGAGAIRATLQPADHSMVSSFGDDDTIALTLPPPSTTPKPWSTTWRGRELSGHVVTIGVPHLVVDWPESLAHAPVEALGADFVHHELEGPGGVNVNLVRWPAPNRLEIRTYERGVFSETLACGTGVLAAVAARGAGPLPLRKPVAALTRGGFTLMVGDPWSLAGDARLLARGQLMTAAGRVPPPPPWSP